MVFILIFPSHAIGYCFPYDMLNEFQINNAALTAEIQPEILFQNLWKLN